LALYKHGIWEKLDCALKLWGRGGGLSYIQPMQDIITLLGCSRMDP